MSEWQPIETAPDDGKPFIVYWSKSIMGREEMDVVTFKEYAEFVSYGEPPATHWMRPDPPKVDA